MTKANRTLIFFQYPCFSIWQVDATDVLAHLIFDAFWQERVGCSIGVVPNIHPGVSIIALLSLFLLN